MLARLLHPRYLPANLDSFVRNASPVGPLGKTTDPLGGATYWGRSGALCLQAA